MGNPKLNQRERNFGVQRIIDRIVFLRIGPRPQIAPLPTTVAVSIRAGWIRRAWAFPLAGERGAA